MQLWTMLHQEFDGDTTYNEVHSTLQIKFLRNDWHIKSSFMWHSHLNFCLLLPEPHVFQMYVCPYIIKFSLHGCCYIVYLILKLCWSELWKWYLTLWDDNQGKGSITKFSVIFSKTKSGHCRPSLYKGVFGLSLTSLFNVSKPLPLFIIGIPSDIQ